MSELQFCIGCGALIPFKYDEPKTWCSEKCKEYYKSRLQEELKEYLTDGPKTENEIKKHLEKKYNPDFISEYLQELTKDGVLKAKYGEITVYRLIKKSSPDPPPCCEVNPELQKVLSNNPMEHFSADTVQKFINYLSEHPHATKKQISKWLGKSHTTVENILRYLRRLGLIESVRNRDKKFRYSLTKDGSKLKG